MRIILSNGKTGREALCRQYQDIKLGRRFPVVRTGRKSRTEIGKERQGMYWKETWYFRNSIEHEYKYPGNYGAKGEKRAKKKKLTPEQIRQQNQRNREKKVRRLIKANFGENDYWLTLKYPKGTRIKIEEAKKHMKKFLDKTRKDYKKRERMFKFIYRLEIGKRGGMHIHILLNRIPDADLILKKNWEQGGMDFTLAYEAGGFRRLAAYLVKPPLDGTDPDGKTKQYHPSRNLVRPQPERKKYHRWTVRKLIEEGPKPTPGFYIVPDSVISGVNPYTGMSYLHYEEERLKRGEGSAGKKKTYRDM